MIVCHCHGISDRAIRRAVREGAASPPDVGRACGAGTTCGGCTDAVRDIIHVETASRENESPGGLRSAPAT